MFHVAMLFCTLLCHSSISFIHVDFLFVFFLNFLRCFMFLPKNHLVVSMSVVFLFVNVCFLIAIFATLCTWSILCFSTP